MFGSALYYPYIDISDPKWLRSAVLFWDDLRTIVPRAIRDPYKRGDTRILWQEGFLEPLRCDLHSEVINTLGMRVVRLMDQHGLNFGRSTDDPNAYSLIHAQKVGNNIRDEFRRARIHPEKISVELRDFYMRAGLARMSPEELRSRKGELDDEEAPHKETLSSDMRLIRDRENDEGEWLLFDSRFANVYMAALAALLAKETDLAALTNEEPQMGVHLSTLLDDVTPHGMSESKKGALVSFSLETLCVDPNCHIDKLLAFKRNRANQIAELSAQFDDVASKMVSCETAIELREKVRETYAVRIRPKLEALKDELRDNSIQSVWDGIQRAVTISVPASGAMAYFSGFTGTALLASGAAITVTDVAIKTYLARRKARRASPYTYLLDVERKFALV
ncbi:MAG: hypothetical protein JNM89_11730 [Hyphomicrobiaceae bacterium]|nr:hypothetical protein [Hyphomicrobiaceae bacterium]